ncbi:putative aspartic-type endopeptidase [Lachnellula suecica]|uniref:Putative aspartic-type endopeptidase n=1 Tax=Lachnellula suecica TaxID=602035 RepID=A0A8T9CK26_9HELO|nr:putative aspartic-type endopeptidase [Lachnellula suecica]
MYYFVSFSYALAVLGSANALQLVKRDNPAVVSFPFEKVDKVTPLPSSFKRDASSLDVADLRYMHSILYLIQLAVGTPPQQASAQLDTGSPNFVLHTVADSLCIKPAPNPCSNYDNANASSTYQYDDSEFSIIYGGGDGATGDDATDVVSVGSASLTNFHLGLQYNTTISENVIGVLFTEDERNGGDTGHTNLPQLLRDQGYIASRAFSLYTNDDRSAGGEVLFGGVDTEKYYGNLVTVDLVPNADTTPPRVTDFVIPLVTVSGTDGASTTAFTGSLPAVVNLDSGTSLTQLDPTLVDMIWTYVGATAYNNAPNLAYVPCNIAEPSKTIDFTFPGITIKVPLSQYAVFPDSNNEFCQFGIEKGNPGGVSILGDTTLSSIYVVYDLDNKQLHLAPADINATASNILQITPGPFGVPEEPGVGGSTILKTSSMVQTSTQVASSSLLPVTSSTPPMKASISSISTQPSSSPSVSGKSSSPSIKASTSSVSTSASSSSSSSAKPSASSSFKPSTSTVLTPINPTSSLQGKSSSSSLKTSASINSTSVTSTSSLPGKLFSASSTGGSSSISVSASSSSSVPGTPSLKTSSSTILTSITASSSVQAKSSSSSSKVTTLSSSLRSSSFQIPTSSTSTKVLSSSFNSSSSSSRNPSSSVSQSSFSFGPSTLSTKLSSSPISSGGTSSTSSTQQISSSTSLPAATSSSSSSSGELGFSRSSLLATSTGSSIYTGSSSVSSSKLINSASATKSGVSSSSQSSFLVSSNSSSSRPSTSVIKFFGIFVPSRQLGFLDKVWNFVKSNRSFNIGQFNQLGFVKLLG